MCIFKAINLNLTQVVKAAASQTHTFASDSAAARGRQDEDEVCSVCFIPYNYSENNLIYPPVCFWFFC